MSEDDWYNAARVFNSDMETRWRDNPGNPNNEWLETKVPVDLGHGPGCRHPWVIEDDGYLYLFYDRILSARYISHSMASDIGSADLREYLCRD